MELRSLDRASPRLVGGVLLVISRRTLDVGDPSFLVACAIRRRRAPRRLRSCFLLLACVSCESRLKVGDPDANKIGLCSDRVTVSAALYLRSAADSLFS